MSPNEDSLTTRIFIIGIYAITKHSLPDGSQHNDSILVGARNSNKCFS